MYRLTRSQGTLNLTFVTQCDDSLRSIENTSDMFLRPVRSTASLGRLGNRTAPRKLSRRSIARMKDSEKSCRNHVSPGAGGGLAATHLLVSCRRLPYPGCSIQGSGR